LKAPRVLPGVRPGPSKVHCRGSSKLSVVNDYASVRAGTKTPYHTPAQTLRRYLASGLEHPALPRLTYERRAVFTPAGDRIRNRAVFVGLRKDGTVKASIGLNRVNTGSSKHWVVGGSTICGK
jgi:hypothetical protein